MVMLRNELGAAITGGDNSMLALSGRYSRRSPQSFFPAGGRLGTILESAEVRVLQQQGA